MLNQKNLKKQKLIRVYKRDLWGTIILNRKLLLIRNYIINLLDIDGLDLNDTNDFYRIDTFEKPIYSKEKTKYGKYFLLRKQFRNFYGCLSLNILKKLINKSYKKKNSLYYFIYLLESRLDVVLYRLHLFKNIRCSRQFIYNKNIIINDRIVRNPNYNLKKGDILTLSKHNILVYKQNLYKMIHSKNYSCSVLPSFFEYDLNNFLFKFINLNIYDVPFFAPVTPYLFLNIINFYKKYYF